MRIGPRGANTILVFLVSGCAINTENSSVMPGVELSKYKSFYVVEDGDDRRDVDDVISAQLNEMGYDSLSGPETAAPESTQILIRYQTEWRWDITYYLAILHIQFIESKTLRTVATGTSAHYSISRKSKSDMVQEVLSNIFQDNEDVVDNYFFDNVPGNAMVAIPKKLNDEALAFSVNIFGYGTQHATDAAFNEALTESMHQYGLFQSISQDGQGDYTLVVVIQSLNWDEQKFAGWSNISNIEARASWAMTQTSTGAIVYNSEIVTSCPEDKMNASKGGTDMTACAIRENIAAGFDELGALKID